MSPELFTIVAIGALVALTAWLFWAITRHRKDK